MKKVIEKLENVARNVYDTIMELDKPELEMPIRSLSNVAYDNKEGYFKQQGRTKTRTLTASTIKTFAQTLRMMSLSKQLVQTQDIATKRDAYYQSKGSWGDAGFKEQSESDSIMDDVEAMVSVNREQLGFIPDEGRVSDYWERDYH